MHKSLIMLVACCRDCVTAMVQTNRMMDLTDRL